MQRARGAVSGPILYPHPHPSQGRGRRWLHVPHPPLAPCSTSLPPCRHRPLHRAGDGALSAPPLLAPDIPLKRRRAFLRLPREPPRRPASGMIPPPPSSWKPLLLGLLPRLPRPSWHPGHQRENRAPGESPRADEGPGRRRPRGAGELCQPLWRKAWGEEDASLARARPVHAGSGSRSLLPSRNKSRLDCSTLGLKRKT